MRAGSPSAPPRVPAALGAHDSPMAQGLYGSPSGGLSGSVTLAPYGHAAYGAPYGAAPALPVVEPLPAGAAAASAWADGTGVARLNGSPPPAPLGSDFAGTALQRRLATEVADREACQLALAKVRRVVGFFRQQVQVATDGHPPTDPLARRVRELAESLEHEVRAAVMSAGGAAAADSALAIGGASPLSSPLTGSPARDGTRGSGYEALRRAVQDAQRRNETLQKELMEQAKANGELVDKLASSQESARRAEEKARRLTEESGSNAKQRAVAEDRLEDVRRRHALEEEQHEKDSKQRLAAAQEACDARCQAMQRSHAAKLHASKSRVALILKDLDKLRSENVEQKRFAQGQMEQMRQHVQQAERSLAHRVEAFVKHQLDLQVTSADATQEAEMRMEAEHEMRVNEVSNWSQRHALLAAERDDLQARLARDVGQLTAQVQALDRAREEEVRRSAEERVRLEQHGQELQQRLSASETREETLRTEMAGCEASRAALEQERRNDQEASARLRQQALEDAQALSSANAGKEALRDQMEEQKRRLTEASDAAVAACREEHEKRLAKEAEQSQAQLEGAATRLRDAEVRIRTTQAELDESRRGCQDASALRTDLEKARLEARDVTFAAEKLEGSLAEAKRELGEERGRLQATVAVLERQRDQTELESRALQKRLEEADKEKAERETAHGLLAAALEGGIQDRDTRLEEQQRQLAQAREQSAATAAEAVRLQIRVQELQAGAEKAALEAKEASQHFWQEKTELREAAEAQAKLVRESEAQRDQTQSQNAALADSIEREKEVSRSELAEATKRMAESQLRHEAAERDLNRVRYLLSESQANHTAMRQEKERVEREAAGATKHREEEVKQVSEALESSVRNEASLARRLEEESSLRVQERQDLERQLDEVRRKAGWQVHEREQRMEELRSEYEARVQSMGSLHAAELERWDLRAEAAMRENEQLRRFLSDDRSQASAMGSESLQAQLESHILKLQQHTSELRSDLSLSRVDAGQAQWRPQAPPLPLTGPPPVGSPPAVRAATPPRSHDAGCGWRGAWQPTADFAPGSSGRRPESPWRPRGESPLRPRWRSEEPPPIAWEPPRSPYGYSSAGPRGGRY